MEKLESREKIYELEVTTKARREFAKEAAKDPTRRYLHLGASTGKESLFSNLTFIRTDELEAIKNLTERSVHHAHIQLPMGFLHGNLPAKELKEKLDSFRELIPSLYPAIELSGEVTIIEYLTNQPEIKEVLHKAGFVLDKKRLVRYPPGPQEDNPLCCFVAVKP